MILEFGGWRQKEWLPGGSGGKTYSNKSSGGEPNRKIKRMNLIAQSPMRHI